MSSPSPDAAEDLGMVLDHAGIEPNPVRAKTIKLPREQKTEINPPTAEHIEAVHSLLPTRYRLPLLVLDATGMRLGELEGLSWGDVDEGRSALARLASRLEDEPAALGECPRTDLRGRTRALSAR
jgi:integrase